MTEDEWMALNKSIDKIGASCDRLGDALSDLGDVLADIPSGTHTKDGMTVTVERGGIIWRTRWRDFWRSILP